MVVVVLFTRNRWEKFLNFVVCMHMYTYAIEYYVAMNQNENLLLLGN